MKLQNFMSKKIIISAIIIILILVGAASFLYPKLSPNQKVNSNREANSAKSYSTLEEYSASIDYTCKSDSDCEIKDVHNCCGYYPECVNNNSKVDPAFVKKACEKESMGGICGFDEIDSCRCVNNRCQGYLKE